MSKKTIHATLKFIKETLFSPMQLSLWQLMCKNLDSM